MDWFLALILVFIAVFLIASNSSYLVDYALVIFVFNRGLRRVLDWMEGRFEPLSPISLVPLAVFAVAMVPFARRFSTLPRKLRLIFACLFAALAYAFVIGLARVQIAAVYALAEALAPVAIFGYAITRSSGREVRDRWIRTSSWCAIVASAYGWYQYLTIPPWDAFWVRSVGFEGYLGQLRPMEMTVFSTMAERGPFGAFLGFALVPMVISPRWRTSLRWFGVLLVFSGIMLSMTRTPVVLAAFSILIFVMINRGVGFVQIAVGAVVIGAAMFFGMSALPGANRMQTRLETLSDIQNDGSYKGRLEIYQTGALSVLSNPLGSGLGATGLSGRVNTGNMSTQSTIGDAGYLEIPATYGWPATLLLLTALWKMWEEMAVRFRCGFRSRELLLARAFMLALIPACFIANIITQFSILWLVFGIALNPRTFAAFLRHKLRIAGNSQRTPAIPSELHSTP